MTSDGTQTKELAADRYQRQPVSFSPRAPGAASGRQFMCKPSSSATSEATAGNVTRAAIYQGCNQLVAYSFVKCIAVETRPGEVLFWGGPD